MPTNPTTRRVQARFEGDISDLEAAAKRGENLIDGFGRTASRKFTRSFEEEHRKSGLPAFARAAQSGLEAFGVAFQGGIARSPAIAAALGLAVLTALTVAMPVIGSLAAGLLVAAFGGGLAALGLITAKRSKEVREVLKDLSDYVGEQLQRISEPFEQTWLTIAAVARETFETFLDPLEDSFSRVAPALSVFVEALGEAIEGFAPAIGPVSDAFIAMLGALAPELPGIMDGLAEAIIAVAESIEANPYTFAALIAFLFEVVEQTIRFVAWLSRLANWFQEHPNVTAFLVKSIKALLFPFAAFNETLDNAHDGLRELEDLLENNPYVAVISAIAEPFFRIVALAVSGGLAFAALRFVAKLDVNWSAVANGVYDAINFAFGWARRVFIAVLTGDWEGVRRAVNEAIELGRSWARRIFKATLGFGVDASGIGRAAASIAGNRAEGGVMSAGRSYLVGERGREIVTVGGPARATSAEDLGGGPSEITIPIYIGDEVERVVRVNLREHDRRTKRAVASGALRGAYA